MKPFQPRRLYSGPPPISSQDTGDYPTVRAAPLTNDGIPTRGRSQWAARATPTTTAAAPAINAPAARAFAQAPYVPALPRTPSPSSFNPKRPPRERGYRRRCNARLIANYETTQRPTARRDRHGQQANSLLCVAAPHHPRGNPGFCRSQNSTKTTAARVPKNCMRVALTPMQ